MFNSIKSGLKVIKTGKDIKKAIETVPDVRDSSAEFYNKMILAVENNYISDESLFMFQQQIIKAVGISKPTDGQKRHAFKEAKNLKEAGFDPEDKVKIANDYSLDKICKDIGFNRDYIELNDETLKVIISTYCTEKGVRKLEQCLNSLVMKINLYHLTRDLKNLNVKDLNPFKNFETPYKITPERAIKLLDPIYRKDDMSLMIKMMYS